jgi:hypothetical protein
MAEPGALVVVTVTDEFIQQVTAFARARKTDDPGTGEYAGEWFTAPNITNLGSHDVTPSRLTFTASVCDLPHEERESWCLGAQAAGHLSASASFDATKLAASADDTTPPELKSQKNGRPPTNWCHTAVGVGCLATNAADSCISHTLRVAVQDGLRDSGVQGAVKSLTGQSPTLNGDPNKKCTQEGLISGYVNDNVAASQGIASEVADVVVRISHSDETVWGEFHSFIRQGTRAFYGVKVRVADFDPDTYWVEEYAIDAAGNVGDPDGLWHFTVEAT